MKDFMFIGREQELETLNALWEKQTFQMVVLYGRRRIGKTTLISQFLKNKPGLFFSAQEANDRMNLEMFSRKIYRYFNIPETTGRFHGKRGAWIQKSSVRSQDGTIAAARL